MIAKLDTNYCITKQAPPPPAPPPPTHTMGAINDQQQLK